MAPIGSQSEGLEMALAVDSRWTLDATEGQRGLVRLGLGLRGGVG
jgi:hypothetical protein